MLHTFLYNPLLFVRPKNTLISRRIQIMELLSEEYSILPFVNL